MIRAGQPGPVELDSVRTWDPRSGWSITRRWRGQKEYLLAYEATCRSAGARTSWDPTDDSSIVILSAVYGAEESQPPGEALSDRWEMVGNDLEKSLWELPWIVHQIDLIPEDANKVTRIALLKRNVENLAQGNLTIVKEDGTEVEGAGAISEFRKMVENWKLTWEPIWYLMQTLASGQESWTVSQWVLRHTQVIANNSTIKPSLANVGKIYTTQMLQGAEAIPTTIKFDLPDGVWLKRTPTIEQTAADKWTISQEYWHADQFNGFVYDVAT